MMNHQAVREMLLSGRAQGPGFDELRRSFATGTQVDEIGQGHQPAGEALAIYAIRQRTVATAGIAVEGLDELLSELSVLQAEEEVSLFHFGTSTRVFTVVVHELSRRMVGCISAPRLTAA